MYGDWLFEFKMSHTGYMSVSYDIRENTQWFCVDALYDESIIASAGGRDYREFQSGNDAAHFIEHVLTNKVGWMDMGSEIVSPDGKSAVRVFGDSKTLEYRLRLAGFGQVKGYCTIR